MDIDTSTDMGRVLMQLGGAANGMDEIKKVLTNMEPSGKLIFTVLQGQEMLGAAIDIVEKY